MQYQDPERRALLHGGLPRRLPRLALHDQGPEAQALGEAPSLDRCHRKVQGRYHGRQGTLCRLLYRNPRPGQSQAKDRNPRLPAQAQNARPPAFPQGGNHQPPLPVRPDHRLISVPVLDLVQEIRHGEVLATWRLGTAGSSSPTSASKPETRSRWKTRTPSRSWEKSFWPRPRIAAAPLKRLRRLTRLGGISCPERS